MRRFGFDGRLGGAERHFVVYAEHAVDLRLALQDRLEDVMTLLAVESGALVGHDDHVGMFLQFVVEPGHTLNIRAGALNALEDDDLALAAELFGHALRDLHAHRIVAHPDKTGMHAGDVLVESDDRYSVLFRLLDRGRQTGRVGRLQNDEVDALADERFDLARLFLHVAFAVLNADLHSEARALARAFVAPIFDQRMGQRLEDDPDFHPLGVDELARRRGESAVRG